MTRISEFEKISDKILDIILLDQDEVVTFIKDENENGFFETNSIKIRCKLSKSSDIEIQDLGNKDKKVLETETSKKYLSWGLFMLAGMDFRDLGPHKTYNPYDSLESFTHSLNESQPHQDSLISGHSSESPFHSNAKSESNNITEKGLIAELENLLKCKYLIEIDSEEIESGNKQRLMSRSSASFRRNVLNVEQEVAFGGKTKRLNGTHVKSSPGHIELTFHFFHLVILWRRKCDDSNSPLDTPIVHLLFKIMARQCGKDIDDEGKDEWKNLSIALSETIQTKPTNVYLNGMNPIHLASFCQCTAFEHINAGLIHWNVAIDMHLQEKNIELSTPSQAFKSISAICESAMKQQTYKTKETPSNIAARYGYKKLDPLGSFMV